MNLNPSQKSAVETLSGPLLVLAGAGTGKTSVVTERVARLIQSRIQPNRILAVTFTNKASKEMLERITKRLGQRHETKPVISTFHSYCLKILRRQIHHLGYPNDFSVYDRGDQESVAREALRDIRVVQNAIRPGDFLQKISSWKSAGLTCSQAFGQTTCSRDYLIATAYKKYQEKLKMVGALDFDDLLLLTEYLFANYKEVLQAEATLFDHILVDEYQDTNMSQYKIIKSMALGHRNLCVVGDDDQAIYGWRGAEVTHILNFKKDWADAKIVRLETNYRSTNQIIEWANRLIVFNRHRHAKTLQTAVQGDAPCILQYPDGDEEAKAVVSQIANRIQTTIRKPRDFAILFRTNEQPRVFEMELRAAKIPYQIIGGQSFFDRKEVKDALAYLKLLVHPRDNISLLRVINTPPRGIGATAIKKLTQEALDRGKTHWETMTDSQNHSPIFEGKTYESVAAFTQLVQDQGNLMKRQLTGDAVASFFDRIGYQKEIDRLYPDLKERESRWNSIGEVVSAVASYLQDNPTGTLRGFLDNTSLGGSDFPGSDDKKLDKNAVTLMTYHAAKGLEFKEVYMVGMEEGILPHSRSLKEDEDDVDEERRLCYVGITRAKSRLTMTMAIARQKWGKLRPTIPSRFLYEVTNQADNPRYQKIIAGEAK